MFNQYGKNDWVADISSGNKRFLKKGKESNYLIGRLVSIDWNLMLSNETRGANSIQELSYETRLWLENNEEFIVTDINKSGIRSTAILDHRFEISVYRVYDTLYKQYLYNNSNINEHGYFYTDLGDSEEQNPNISNIQGYDYIVKNKKVCGGRPTIIGTRIEPWHLSNYNCIEEIFAHWNHLTNNQVSEALSYYRSNINSQSNLKMSINNIS